jgi:hypothetical protein
MNVIGRLLIGFVLLQALVASAARAPLEIERADYVDRVHAIWTGQMLAVLLGMPYEHKVASVLPLENLPMLWKGKPATFAPVDDDWYYEMAAIRALEKHGIGLTVEQLGEEWLLNDCGSWGSSEQARLNLEKDIKAPESGHPRYNKFWFTIGPQFSADVWGALAPGLPNVAGSMARDYGHVNGYAEGTDGGVFTAALISLAFVDRDIRKIVREATTILDSSSPFRQAVEQMIELADAGRSFEEVVLAVEDRWHTEYPATNNAVANGAIYAAGLWFGGGEFWPTMNLIAGAADYTDADCNMANAAAVVGAMHGMKALPAALVAQLNDRIVGTEMGKVVFTTPVDESILELARRTAVLGEKILKAQNARIDRDTIVILAQSVVTQPAERFVLADLMKYWNPDWTLERAGFGGASPGWQRIFCMTGLEGDVLTTFPRDSVRACVIRRTAKLSAAPRLTFDVGTEAGRAWELLVYVNNTLTQQQPIVGDSGERTWRTISIDLKEHAGRETTLRLYQRVLVANRTAGNALWRNLKLE